MYTLSTQKDKSFIDVVHVPPVVHSSIANRSGSIKQRGTEFSIRPPAKSLRTVTVQGSGVNNIGYQTSKRNSQNCTPAGERASQKTNIESMKNWVVYKGTKNSRALDLCKPLFFE